MPTLKPDIQIKVRKDCSCFFCGEIILKGEQCWYRFGITDNQWWHMRFHDECRNATIDWEEFDFECFDPGSLIRGSDEPK